MDHHIEEMMLELEAEEACCDPFEITLIKCKRGKSPCIDFCSKNDRVVLKKRISADELGFVKPPFAKR